MYLISYWPVPDKRWQTLRTPFRSFIWNI